MKSDFSLKLRKLNKVSMGKLLNEVGLPKLYTQFLIKYYVEEVPIENIADEFGYTVEATRGLIFKARKTLRIALNTQYELYSEEIKRIINFLDVV